MATFLAHIKVHEGKEKRFEEIAKELFSATAEGRGFGYTVAVSENPIVADARRSVGAFGWGGALGTRSWSDPEEELTAVILIQQPVREVQNDFENAVQQAIIN